MPQRPCHERSVNVTEDVGRPVARFLCFGVKNTGLGGKIFVFMICLKQIFLGRTKFGGEQTDFGGNCPECPKSWYELKCTHLLILWTTHLENIKFD